jgi:hypothetical protein
VQEVPLGPPEQVRRLERYRQEHRDVDIQPPGADSAVWRAFRDGNLIAYGFTLMVFLERLGALPELLGAAQDFGVHLPAIPLSCCRESAGPQDGRAGRVEPLRCTYSRRAATRADGPGQRPALPRPRTSGDMLAQFMAGMTAGWAAGDGATCLPPPTGSPGAGR